jgi:hypothetical protein
LPTTVLPPLPVAALQALPGVVAKPSTNVRRNDVVPTGNMAVHITDEPFEIVSDVAELLAWHNIQMPGQRLPSHVLA